MNTYDEPLSNPSAADFPQVNTASELEDQEPQFDPYDLASLVPAAQRPAQGQLKLGVDSRLQRIRNRFRRFRNDLKRRELELELMPYWHDLAPAIAIVTSAFLVVGSGAAGLIFFNKIQPKIPFYYNAFTGYWEQVDKSTLLILPIIFLIATPIIIRFAFEIYRLDPRLSKTVNILLSVINGLFIIAVFQLYTLILPT